MFLGVTKKEASLSLPIILLLVAILYSSKYHILFFLIAKFSHSDTVNITGILCIWFVV